MASSRHLNTLVLRACTETTLLNLISLQLIYRTIPIIHPSLRRYKYNTVLSQCPPQSPVHADTKCLTKTTMATLTMFASKYRANRLPLAKLRTDTLIAIKGTRCRNVGLPSMSWTARVNIFLSTSASVFFNVLYTYVPTFPCIG